MDNLIAERICDFNKAMHDTANLTRDYDISQGQFTNIPAKCVKKVNQPVNLIANDILAWVWEYRVATLLREYLRGQKDAQISLSTLEDIWNAPVVVVAASNAEPPKNDNTSEKSDAGDAGEKL